MNDPPPPQSPQAAPPAPAPTVPIGPAPPVVPPTVAHSHAGVSPTEAATMAGWAREDVAKGKLSPEAATKLFDELGVAVEGDR